MADAAVAAAVAGKGDAALGSGIIRSGIATIEGVPDDIVAIPLVQHLSDVLPAADLILGGGMLILIVLVHATGVRMVMSHVLKRSERINARPSAWRADVMVGGAVFLLLALHLIEIYVWAAGLVYSNLVPVWRVAGFFAANTYTTVGYGSFVLSQKWQMLAPIIAISGLFTFGWTGSVLVDVVRRGNQIKDAAEAAKAGLGATPPAAP